MLFYRYGTYEVILLIDKHFSGLNRLNLKMHYNLSVHLYFGVSLSLKFLHQEIPEF